MKVTIWGLALDTGYAPCSCAPRDSDKAGFLGSYSSGETPVPAA
jgi:hypothetical protein